MSSNETGNSRGLPFWEEGPASNLLGQHDRGTHHPLAPRNTIRNYAWLNAARAIAAYAQSELAFCTSIDAVRSVTMNLPEVKKYLNGSIGIERSFREAKIRKCLAEWVSHVIQKVEE